MELQVLAHTGHIQSYTGGSVALPVDSDMDQHFSRSFLRPVDKLAAGITGNDLQAVNKQNY